MIDGLYIHRTTKNEPIFTHWKQGRLVHATKDGGALKVTKKLEEEVKADLRTARLELEARGISNP